MVSLDSSFLIDLLAGDRRAVDKARELDQAGEPKYVTPPVVSEVLLGAYRLGAAYLVRTQSLLGSLPLLPFDRESADEAGRLGSELLRRGTPVSQGELFVAAITKRHGERLLTNDRDFSRVPGLLVEGY
ncbi:MAG TPA: PIN domain-containing protein [Thermoplasmata archaeon]|nr:PIN domain-containing protein [Thermoplasmata archaeon]